MSGDCDHFVGEIAGKVISFSKWEKAISAFELKVRDFNTRGRKVQIHHPGFAYKFKFCPDCGAHLDGLAVRELSIKG